MHKIEVGIACTLHHIGRDGEDTHLRANPDAVGYRIAFAYRLKLLAIKAIGVTALTIGFEVGAQPNAIYSHSTLGLHLRAVGYLSLLPL